MRHPLDSTSTDVQDPDAGTHVLAEFLARMQEDDAVWESWTPLGN